jgi:hypothetical protein
LQPDSKHQHKQTQKQKSLQSQLVVETREMPCILERKICSTDVVDLIAAIGACLSCCLLSEACTVSFAAFH